MLKKKETDNEDHDSGHLEKSSKESYHQLVSPLLKKIDFNNCP